jgi:hypothetical protein
MDERDGVTIARQRGFKVVGTLAALDLGALPNEMDGIIIKQFVSASMIKQHAHDVLDLRARRARQGKLA